MPHNSGGNRLFFEHEETHLIALYYLKEGCVKVEFGLFSHVTIKRARGNGLKLHQERLGLDIRKNLFSKRNGLHKEVAEELPLEVFKKHLDAVLKDVV